MTNYYIGVDVGTGSVRAGLLTEAGHIIATSVQPITIKNPLPGHYEQSAMEIWEAVEATVNGVLAKGQASADQVKGIGFDATCSLVVEGEAPDNRLSVGGSNGFDVIMWMDHRAGEEANLINSTNHCALDYVGGKVSLEMQLPKLLWLKNHNPQLWSSARCFFDLPDWLTYMATGAESRSFCSVVCKWNYLAADKSNIAGWNSGLFDLIGLEELKADSWRKIGQTILAPGTSVGAGLSRKAAEALGLKEGTAVGTSLIDAHAGALGMLKGSSGVVGSLGLVSGTSTCHMLLSETGKLVSGVWGPYWSAIIDGLWLMEGGQSATGSLLDHIITTHPTYHQVKDSSKGLNMYSGLEEQIVKLTTEKELENSCFITEGFHMTADFHGNRSPLADPTMTGSMVGLSLVENIESLAIKYLATIQAICYGTRHIIEAMVKEGHKVDNVTVCGGLAKSRYLLQTMADVVGVAVHVPGEPESVLLGAGMLGMAAHLQKPLQEILTGMKAKSTQISPTKSGNVESYHARKYRVYLSMLEDQIKYRDIMNG